MTKEEIIEQYSMREIVERYGYAVNRNNMCKCMFHNEKTPSFKVYAKSFYCFGCNRGGDIFNFVELIEGVDFKTAYIELGGTYKKGVNRKTPDTLYSRVNRLLQKKQRDQELKKQRDRAYECKKNIRYITAYEQILEKNDVFSDLWCYAYNKLQYQYYLFDAYAQD